MGSRRAGDGWPRRAGDGWRGGVAPGREEVAVERVVSDRIAIAAPTPRLERVTAWITTNDIDALVVTGPALVNWITGYSRYYGGPAAAVISPAGRRTLVVLRDEVAVAERVSDAEAVTGYGERGLMR